MRLSEQLKLLAKGIHPETGVVLDDSSLTNRPEVIRSLYDLSEELLRLEKPKKSIRKREPKVRREINMSEGKPPKSHFPWSGDEKKLLEETYKSNPNIEQLANSFERSVLAIAVQLQKLGLISEEKLESYRER